MRIKTLLFPIVLLPIASFAQINITTRAEKILKVEKYDSLSNFLGENYMAYIGQELFVLPKSENLRRYGYEGFYEEPEGKYYKPLKPSSLSSNTKYEMLEGKTFKVVDVFLKGKDIVNRDIIYFKLETEDDTLFYKYNARSKYSFPFVVLGYMDKLKKNYIGTRHCLRSINDKSLIDYVTGENVKMIPGTYWKCSDIIVDSKNYDIQMLFTNEKGETISNKDSHYKSLFIPEVIAKKLIAKYGKSMFDIAINGKIKVGMTEELVKVSWGEPKDINYSSYGSQWVYDGQYIYFKNGRVTDWN